MAALTEDRAPISSVGPAIPDSGTILEFDVIASDIIFRGAFVALTIGTGDLEPANVSAGDQIIGVSLEKVDNSSGAAGDKRAKVLVAPMVRHILATATKAEIGKPVYASDDQTLSLVSTSNSKVGIVVAVPEVGIVNVQIGFPGELLATTA